MNTTVATNPDMAGLLAAEEGRRLAMLAGDTQALGELLSESLVYRHSTGLKDSRQSYLEKLASGALRYQSLTFMAPVATLIGTAGMVAAEMHATVQRGELRQGIASTYLAVWQHTPDGWKLLAVQATALPG
ncbi:MAG: nuclear transport factor 2 family protein [Polaromonas sp.]|nr:nuclear transport factor 2 family protein [Polaromonas sp.]